MTRRKVAVVGLVLLCAGAAPALATTYLPLQTFDGNAGKWLNADLGWVKMYSGDLQVTNDTALANPAIDGSTFTGSEGAEKLPFTPASGNATYVLTCKAVGPDTGYSQGVVGFGWSAGWWWQGTNPSNGGWILDLSALGGGAVNYGLTATAGRVLTLVLVVDQANLKAWGMIMDGGTVLLVTPKATITSAVVDGVVVGSQSQAGLDVDDIMVDDTIPAVPAHTYLPLQTFDADAGKWLGADLGWTYLYGNYGDLQVTGDTALANPAIQGSTFTNGYAFLKKPFSPAPGVDTYVLTCKAVGGNTGYSQGVVGFGVLGGWWWNGASGGGWELDLRDFGGGTIPCGLPETAGRVLTLVVMVDQANMQAQGFIKDGNTTLLVTSKTTITSAAVDGVVVGSQNQSGLDVDDILVENTIPVVPAQTYLPVQTFEAEAGKWLEADLGWTNLYSSLGGGDLQVTDGTGLTNPAIQGSTFTSWGAFLKKPFTPAAWPTTYVLTCRAVGPSTSVSQGVVGFGVLGGWWWNGTQGSTGGWTLDLRAFGGGMAVYGLPETAGRVLTLQMVVDEINMQAWGFIKDGETTLLMTPKTTITSSAIDGVVVGSQNQSGLDVDDILVDGNVPLEPVATPTFDPDGGSYSYTTSPQTVTVACTTPGATIHYTTDGSEPTESSGVCGGPITVDHTLTLKARAWAGGYAPSNLKTAVYAFVLTQATIPQCTLAIDGNVSDWPAAALWSPPYVWWNGTALTSTTQARFAWSDAQDMLYVTARTNEQGLRPGGYFVVGMTKSTDSVPVLNVDSTQLGFFYDAAQPNKVLVVNETGGSTAGVAAACSFDGVHYTYEIAIPLWSDWTAGTGQQPLSANDTLYVYSTLQDNMTPSLNGMDLSFYGNPAFYSGANASPNAWTRAATLTLQASSYTSADLSAMLAAMDAKSGDPTWSPQMDLDGDGEITSTDLSILLANMP